MDKFSKLGDSLVRLKRVIDWNMFRPILEKALQRNAGAKKAGRPSYDSMLMFKIHVLQRFYNLNDDQLEFQVNDRMSFMRFLGLKLSDRVSDSKMVWAFREKLTQTGAMKELFDCIGGELERAQLISRRGSIVDATFVEGSRQRNCSEENKQIKDGEAPEEQKKSNRVKSKVRCRVEHVIGFMNTSMKGLPVRSIGLARASFCVGLSNLIYNIADMNFCVGQSSP